MIDSTQPTDLKSTPRTDKLLNLIYERHKKLDYDDFNHYFFLCKELCTYARTLERELNIAKSEIERLKQKVKSAVLIMRMSYDHNCRLPKYVTETERLEQNKVLNNFIKENK